MSAAARTAGHVISFGITLSLMSVVLVFSVNSMRRRFRDRELVAWRKYGPLACLLVAVPFIMADLTRHLSQDGTLLVGDVLGIPLILATIPCYVDVKMAKTAKHWGPFNPPRGVPLGPGSREFRKRLAILAAVATAGIAVLCTAHLKPTASWFGAQQLQWQECGNNPDYPRVNQTWNDDTCFWSSSQFKCNLFCCVPEDKVNDGGRGIPPGGYRPVPTKDFPKADDGKCECHCCPLSDENLHHLAPMGILFTMVFTYFGFTLLAVGTLWNADITEKLREVRRQWRVLRGKDPPPSAAKKPAKFKLSDQPVSPSVQGWMQSRTQCRGEQCGAADAVTVATAEGGAPLTAGMVRYSSSQWCEGLRAHPQ